MNETVLDLIKQDLAKSSLVIDDMHVRVLANEERGATGTPFHVNGYAIPYFTIGGKPLSYYRVRLFDYTPKYKQVGETPNHVYFPRYFGRYFGTKPYVILTEGEKKAAAICKLGYPCVAFGGVDSWRNRIITLPAETALNAGKNDTLKAKVPGGSEIQEDYNSPFAVGLQELIDQCIAKKLHVIICYDSDDDGKVKSSVQRAAAGLAFELRFKGIEFNKIRQLILPRPEKLPTTTEKFGLDDFIKFDTQNRLDMLLNRLIKERSAFPVHPAIREYISTRLQKKSISRKEQQSVAMAILSDLDTNGIRYRAESGLVHYFDRDTKKLFRADFPVSPHSGGFETPFVQFLYRRYSLSAADKHIIIWLGTQFSAEPPIDSVSPYKVFARPEEPRDVAFWQISDSRFVSISADNIKVWDNGSGGVLFESDQVEPVDENVLQDHLASFHIEDPKRPLPNWWGDTLNEVRLRDKERQRVATSLLYYMSPFLFRWRGMQLPVELIVGESGSGKSTLCELRLSILTGRAHLRNAPADLKDWHASVASTGGLHVTDNVQLTDQQLRQRLSDEICRLVTEPNPTIEQRKYFTNAELMRLPVRAVFAITAIRQPFQNADLIQRSTLLEFDKSTSDGQISYDSEWKSQQLKRHGGREAWMAHHMLVLQRFFQNVRHGWNNYYQAKYRLIHFEQSMILMAQVFGLPVSWVVDYLSNVTNRAVTEADWVLEGLIEFAQQEEMPKGSRPSRFGVSEISAWAASQDEYEKCEILINTRKLGRYLIHNKALVQSLTGISELPKQNNRMTYKINPVRRLDRRVS